MSRTERKGCQNEENKTEKYNIEITAEIRICN